MVQGTFPPLVSTSFKKVHLVKLCEVHLHVRTITFTKFQLYAQHEPAALHLQNRWLVGLDWRGLLKKLRNLNSIRSSKETFQALTKTSPKKTLGNQAVGILHQMSFGRASAGIWLDQWIPHHLSTIVKGVDTRLWIIYLLADDVTTS